MGTSRPSTRPAPADDDQLRAGTAADAMHAVARLLSPAADLQGPDVVRRRLVQEVRDFFGAARVVLLDLDEQGERVSVVAASPALAPGRPLALDDLPPVALLVRQRLPALLAREAEVAAVDRALGADGSASGALLLPLRAGSDVRHVLLVLDRNPRELDHFEIGVAGSLAAAGAAGLAQARLAEDQAVQVAQQGALARAAKTLTESLDLNHVLVKICSEAVSILDGDNAIVYRGGASGLTIEAVHGIPPEAVGYRVAPGVGLSGRVAQLDRPLITNDYAGLPSRPDEAFFGEVCSCVAVPMHWDGELRGVLAVGFHRRHRVTREDMNLLEAFGELAAAACRNASAHAGLARIARTDGLTGCLNHTAMQHMLRREIDRCGRTGHSLSLILIDLDDFKTVNEEHGHLAGDEVLRRVGAALRATVRPYDLVARYGGDEFAIVAIEADEQAATELARRTVDGIARALVEGEAARGACGASAGVAEWEPGQTPTTLIDVADRALMHGKGDGRRRSVIARSDLPMPTRPAPERASPPAVAAPAEEGAAWPDYGREQTERLRKRTRELALANALGARLSAMTDPGEILAATADELHRAFGYFLCAVVRLREDGYVESVARRGQALARAAGPAARPRAAGVIGRCLRERRPIVVADVRQEHDYVGTPETADVHAELVVPLWVGDELWGAIDIEEIEPGAFDEDDARIVQTVARLLGSALRSAMLYERLDAAYLGTADALAAALESSEREPREPRRLVGWAMAVGAQLGLPAEDLRTLRLAAIFHDIGRVAVPGSVLEKRGPLTDAERAQVERHAVAGERILESVDFLADVRPLVRHAHERWDGSGYPDGLAGERIPLGSRIVHVCDAYDAMTAPRPYRAPLSDSEARAQLVEGAGEQFDASVVAALIDVLDAHERPPTASMVEDVDRHERAARAR